MTRAELIAGRGSEEQQVAMLLAPFHGLAADRAVTERAGHLRRTSALRMPDALIAAAAIEHNCTLVTRNPFDFAGIPRPPGARRRRTVEAAKRDRRRRALLVPATRLAISKGNDFPEWASGWAADDVRGAQVGRSPYPGSTEALTH